jgi:2-oxoisovalerate dehydrogenase E2 component (dihydrolipoyl transacylase)
MARYVFKLPDVGEGIAEAEIVKWHVGVGAEVREESPLVDIMTEKATVEIAAPVSGRIVSRAFEEGSMVAVGSELVVFETAAAAAPARAPEPQKAVQAVAPPPMEPEAAPSPPARESGVKVLAAPAVRARARALAIDLAGVAATGPGGRIAHRDLDRFLVKSLGAPGRPAAPLPPATEAGVETIRVTGLRRKIAERMELANRIPHFSYVEEVDVTALEDLRAARNAEAKGTHLTVLPYLIRALARGIARHPAVNAHYDGAAGEIRRFSAVHVGIATQTERGLMVPVVRNAEAKSLEELAAEIARLAKAARESTATREELSGSTITLTSLGALGGVAATPIINAPEVAIVGVNRIAERPMVRDGQIAVRRMMNLSSSFDHRIVDGHEAALFIKTLKELLEEPAQ